MALIGHQHEPLEAVPTLLPHFAIDPGESDGDVRYAAMAGRALLHCEQVSLVTMGKILAITRRPVFIMARRGTERSVGYLLGAALVPPVEWKHRLVHHHSLHEYVGLPFRWKPYSALVVGMAFVEKYPETASEEPLFRGVANREYAPGARIPGMHYWTAVVAAYMIHDQAGLVYPERLFEPRSLRFRSPRARRAAAPSGKAATPPAPLE